MKKWNIKSARLITNSNKQCMKIVSLSYAFWPTGSSNMIKSFNVFNFSFFFLGHFTLPQKNIVKGQAKWWEKYLDSWHLPANILCETLGYWRFLNFSPSYILHLLGKYHPCFLQSDYFYLNMLLHEKNWVLQIIETR